MPATPAPLGSSDEHRIPALPHWPDNPPSGLFDFDMAMQSSYRVLTWLDLTELSYAFLTFIRRLCAVGRVSASRYVRDQWRRDAKIDMCLICALLLTACEPTAQKVAESWQAALNSGDVDAACFRISQKRSSVSVVPPGPDGDRVYTGKAETRAWYEATVAQKGSGSLSSCVLSGETLTCESHILR